MYHGQKFSGWRFLCAGRRQSGQTPYWENHARLKNRLMGDQLFDKWCKLPNRALALYWRLHPDEALASNK